MRGRDLFVLWRGWRPCEPGGGVVTPCSAVTLSFSPLLPRRPSSTLLGTHSHSLTHTQAVVTSLVFTMRPASTRLISPCHAYTTHEPIYSLIHACISAAKQYSPIGGLSILLSNWRVGDAPTPPGPRSISACLGRETRSTFLASCHAGTSSIKPPCSGLASLWTLFGNVCTLVHVYVYSSMAARNAYFSARRRQN